MAPASESIDPILSHLIRQKQTTPYEQGTIRKATPAEKKEFLSVIALITNRAFPNGSTGLENFDVKKFLRDIPSVNLYVNTSDQALIGSGTRTGSLYLVEQKAVILNISLLAILTSDPGAGILLIHEYLGALGYPDEQNQISAYFYLQLHSNKLPPADLSLLKEKLNEHLQKNPMVTKNTLFEAGGATGVGGGGDPAIAEIKALTLIAFLNATNASDLTQFELILSSLLNMVIEPSGNANAYLKISPSGFPHIEIAAHAKKGIVFVIDQNYWRTINSDGNPQNVYLRSQFIAHLLQLNFYLLKIPGTIRL